MSDRADDWLTEFRRLRAEVDAMRALGASRWGLGPEVGFAQATSPVTVTSTTESAGSVCLSAGAITFDGLPVVCHLTAPYVQPAAVAGALVFVSLFEGATQICRLGLVGTPQGTNAMFVPFSGRHRFTPTAGSHTYTVTAHQSGGNGTFGAGGGGGVGDYAPALITFNRT